MPAARKTTAGKRPPAPRRKTTARVTAEDTITGPPTDLGFDVEEVDGLTPISITSAPARERPVMTHLFTIDDTPYYVPARPPANIALKALKMIREQGEAVGAGWILEELLGEDSYTALANCPDVGPKQMGQIMGAVTQIAIGALEDSEATGPLGRG
jgi:hypothetical protein